MSIPENPVSFADFGLSDSLVQALNQIGYETPSPIQTLCIPFLLEGHDIIGQAQTGTGKTAAFALPILDKIDLAKDAPQVLILAPTRELAIQVSEAIQSYARFLKGIRVVPIYGGQSYSVQLKPLRRGAHVIVGTPGRVMDHISRKSLVLKDLHTLVLDEADEMLRMGFIDDVKWVMEHIPKQRQIALFSATMPQAIQQVAEKFLHQPKVVKIKNKTATAMTILQQYWQVSGYHKLDALTRILEIEDFDALIIFVRTKTATVELADKLQARGFTADAINGDMTQMLREKTINQLKKKKIDILVATDVAARGLDVERISHVINYDIPNDPESYVHRIGRTGRAGRAGKAILFVAPREKRMLRIIEKVTRQPIELLKFPTAESINQQRIGSFKQKITNTLERKDLDVFSQLLEEYCAETDADIMKIASALAYIAQGKQPLLLNEKEVPKIQNQNYPEHSGESKKVRFKPLPLKSSPDVMMKRFKIAVGYRDDVTAGNIVGAIANESKIPRKLIGNIDIYNEFSTVDLPSDTSKKNMDAINEAWVCGKKLELQPFDEKSHDLSFNKPSRVSKKDNSYFAKKRTKSPKKLKKKQDGKKRI